MRQLGLALETAFFFKNLELLGHDDIDGETYFGVIAPLRLRYRANEDLSIELGAVLGQNFGDNDSLDIATPLVRLVYEPADGVFVIAGNIFPTHWIHQALLDDTQRFREDSEQGMQLRVDRAFWKQDTWINWRIREGDVRAEEFEIAHTSQLRVFDAALRVTAEFMWVHAGGEVSTSDRLENNLNYSIGGSYGQKLPSLDWFEEVRVGGRVLFSSDDTRDTSRTTGHGSEYFAHVDLQPLSHLSARISGSYWDGDDFLGRRGDPLYRFAEYAQFGGSLIYRLTDLLRIETSIVGQLADHEDNYSYLIYLTWGEVFPLAGVISPPR
jgi:hypothetical protein